MQYTAVVKEHCISLFQCIAICILRIVQHLRKSLERRVKLGRRRKRQGRLIVGGVINVINIPIRRELDRRMVAVEVVAIVDILKLHWGLGENVKFGRVGLPEVVRDMESVDEGGDPSCDAVAQTMEDLIPRGVFEISELKRIMNHGWLYK